jgi:hypothetical protein
MVTSGPDHGWGVPSAVVSNKSDNPSSPPPRGFAPGGLSAHLLVEQTQLGGVGELTPTELR